MSILRFALPVEDPSFRRRVRVPEGLHHLFDASLDASLGASRSLPSSWHATRVPESLRHRDTLSRMLVSATSRSLLPVSHLFALTKAVTSPMGLWVSGT